MPNPTSKLNLVINGVTTQLDIHDANAVDLTSNQTVGGNKEFTGTTTAHDLVPSATDTYNFGSSTAQWNNAYIKSLTINGVACGDILTHNASEFVGVSTAQTIGGDKTFTGFAVFNPYRVQIKQSSQEIGVVPSSNQWNGISFTDKNNRNTFSIEQAFLLNGNTMLHFSMMPNIADGSLLRIFESTYIASTAEIITKSRTLIPDANNSRDLGTSSRKWKTFNGVNPGALSLPGTFVNVDTTNWVLDGSDVNIFTPTSDGWLGIQATDTVYDQMHYVFVGRNDNVSYHSQNVLSPINALWDGEYHGCVFIPVIKNVRYDIRCICSSIIAKFYPCQGNV